MAGGSSPLLRRDADSVPITPLMETRGDDTPGAGRFVPITRPE